MDYTLILSGLGKGLLGGLIYGIVSFGKNLKANPDVEFDAEKIAPTLALSALAGIIIEYTGGDIGTTYTALDAAGITVILQKIYGAAFGSEN